MAKTVGRITSIAINPRKLSFLCNPVAESQPEVRLILYNDAPNTHTIAQVQIATRSWMTALLQTALVHEKIVVVDHGDDKVVDQLELFSKLELNFDIGGGEGKAKKPGKIPVQRAPVTPVKRPTK